MARYKTKVYKGHSAAKSNNAHVRETEVRRAVSYLMSLDPLYRMYIKFMDKCCFLGTFVKYVSTHIKGRQFEISDRPLVGINQSSNGIGFLLPVLLAFESATDNFFVDWIGKSLPAT